MMLTWKRAIASVAIAAFTAACPQNHETAHSNVVEGNTPATTAGTGGMIDTTTGMSGGQVVRMTAEEKQFTVDAGLAGMAEITLAQLARDRAQHDAVKQYANRLLVDHTKAHEQLKMVVTQTGLALPTELKPEHQDAKTRLEGLTGSAFDKAYMQQMVADHQQTIARFEEVSPKVTDSTIKGWIDANLPVLREHLAQARQTLAKLG